MGRERKIYEVFSWWCCKGVLPKNSTIYIHTHTHSNVFIDRRINKTSLNQLTIYLSKFIQGETTIFILASVNSHSETLFVVAVDG